MLQLLFTHVRVRQNLISTVTILPWSIFSYLHNILPTSLKQGSLTRLLKQYRAKHKSHCGNDINELRNINHKNVMPEIIEIILFLNNSQKLSDTPFHC